MKHIFTDLDGKRFYELSNGDIVGEDRNLVALAIEDNIRTMLRHSGYLEKRRQEQRRHLEPHRNVYGH